MHGLERPLVAVGSHWSHYKGKSYVVVALCRDCESTDATVVYRSLYCSDDYPRGTVWCRSLTAWNDIVTVATPWPNGAPTKRARFVPLLAPRLARVGVVVLGVGGVGRDLVARIVEARVLHAESYSLALDVVALGDSTGVWGAAAPAAASGSGVSAWTDEALLAAVECKARGAALASVAGAAAQSATLAAFLAARATRCSNALIVVDCSSGSATTAPLLAALEAGHSAVLANKVPLAGSQATFDAFQCHSRRLRCESTVGAGLPIHATLARLRASGDTCLRIDGAFSGTLGFIASALSDGVAFSAAVRDARALGFTEPDPRDDLSGVDVGRKALILARLCGLRIDSLDDVALEALFPPALGTASGLRVDDFVARLGELDGGLAARVAAAQGRGCELRYAASVDVAAATIAVGLAEVPRGSALGGLRGSANLVAFRTECHGEAEPLVVRGAGAGAGVTSTGVLADIVALALNVAR